MDQQKTQDPAQLLTWLDEQQREDRRQLAALRSLAESHGRELEALTKRVEGQERRLTGTNAQLTRLAKIEAALQELKDEILGVLQVSETRLRTADKQLESRLEIQAPQLAGLAKSLETVQGALAALETQVEATPARIDEQVEQTARLARDIEELEERFNQTRARAQLHERLSGQTDSTAELARQLEHLEGRLSSTQAQLVKFPQIEAALQETKNEIVFMIDELEEQRKKAVRESAQIRDAERKDVRAALDNIERRLEQIPPLDERIKGLEAEDKRLRSLISEQEQRIPPLRESIEQHGERISYLEEGQPRTSHRIDELEVQIPPLREALKENAGKIRFLEEWAQRSAEKIDELKRFEDHMERWRAAFIEEIRQGEQRRDRRLSDWEKTLNEHEEAIGQWREILRRYEVAHQDNRRIIGDLQALAQRLERDQAEVAEQQRLADERLQRDMDAWQDENEKRWYFFLKQRDYDWEQETQRDTEQDRLLALIEARHAELAERFAVELDRLDENDRRVLARLVSLIRQLGEAVEGQIAYQSEQRETLGEALRSLDVLATRSPAERRPRPVAGRPRSTETEE